MVEKMPAKKKTSSTNKIPTQKLPKWITDHFTDSLNSQELLMRIVGASSRGISVLRGMPGIVKVLAKVGEGHNYPDYTSKLARAETEALLAANEVEKDFPVLHGFAVVALWSWMEHFVKDFLALWIMHRRDAMNTPTIQKLRVRLGEYIQLTKAEQSQMVVELLENELASSLKQGTTRFDSLLAPFGLAVSLDSGNSKTIFELQQIRNAIAHRNGRADRRLRSACPWLKLKNNQQVHVSRKMLNEYSEATSVFLLELLYKVGDLYEFDLRSTNSEKPNRVSEE